MTQNIIFDAGSPNKSHRAIRMIFSGLAVFWLAIAYLAWRFF